MTAVYRDPSEFSDGNHSMEEIADAIRTKQYGKDVREAIAEGFEVIYNDKYMDDLHDDIKALFSKIDSLNNSLKSTNTRIDNVITSVADTNQRIQKLDDDFAKKLDVYKQSVEKELSDLKDEQTHTLETFDDEWQARIDRIVLGTDEEMVSKVVEMILKNKED